MTARLYKIKLWRLTIGIVFGIGAMWKSSRDTK
jgi:hypothetical protein